MARKIALVCMVVGAAAFATGCQVFIASVKSPSDSISGSSDSISGSLGGFSRSSSGSNPWENKGSAQLRYEDDVRVATTAYASGGTEKDAFLMDLGRIAESSGLANWEAEPSTFVAIGAGVRDAGGSEQELGALLDGLGLGDRRSLALAGHRS